MAGSVFKLVVLANCLPTSREAGNTGLVWGAETYMEGSGSLKLHDLTGLQ